MSTSLLKAVLYISTEIMTLEKHLLSLDLDDVETKEIKDMQKELRTTRTRLETLSARDYTG